MARIDRRLFLSGLSAGGASLPFLRLSSRSAPMTDLEALARQLTEAAPEVAMTVAIDAVRKGASWNDVLGATLLAGVRNVNPRPLGFKFHCVLMVPATMHLAAGATDAERPLPILYNVEDFKRAQAADARDGDWQLSPSGEAGNSEHPDRELERGLEEWNEEIVDRALVQLLPGTEQDAMFELLWPFAARDFGSIGHKMIYAAGVHRVLGEIGWQYAEPVLRSLGNGLLAGGPGASSASFAANRKKIDGWPDDWRAGAPDRQASVALMRALRRAGTDEAADLIVGAVGRGVAPDSIWDGLRLAAAELLLRQPGILAVHAVTSMQALHYGFGATRRDATRRLILLQAGAWIAMFRDFLVGRSPQMMQGPALDELEAEVAPIAPAEVFAVAAKDRPRATRLALGRLQAGDGEAFARAVRQQVFQRGSEHHQHKYAAAVLEEATRCDPKWAPYLLAVAASYLPAAGDDSAVYERSRDALRSLK